MLLVVSGIVGWFFVLAQTSRRVAEEETQRQTQLLLQEIEAHKRTDAALQKAKEVAEAANLAKSRYVVGLSHELRTPLNAVLGYAQLLEADPLIPEVRRGRVNVIRKSAEHLSRLIEGLLDISKIEAGAAADPAGRGAARRRHRSAGRHVWHAGAREGAGVSTTSAPPTCRTSCARTRSG